MLYAITRRHLHGTNEAAARQRLLEQAQTWAANRVSYIQLRERDLSARDQVELARAMMGGIRSAQPESRARHSTKLFIHSHPDVALAAGADGVHLPSGSETLTPNEVRKIFSAARRAQMPAISISCHTLQEVETARQQKPDCILFAPVFEKVIASTTQPDSESAQIIPGAGLALLEQACRLASPVAVFALGGVNAENATQCLRAGAAGIAAIRLLQAPALEWRHLA